MEGFALKANGKETDWGCISVRYYAAPPKKAGQTHAFTNLYVKCFPSLRFDDEDLLVSL